MPRADGSIVIDTKLDTKSLETNLTSLGGKLKKAGSIAAGSMAVGVGIAVAALGAFTLSSIKAAEESARVDANLRSTIVSMGLFPKAVDKINDRLGDYATALSNATGVDDELIKSTQAVLFTFNDLAETADVAGGSFDRATQAAVDMAARLGGDAKGNAILLGKALNDPVKGVTALTRAGVQFTEQQKAQIKAAVKAGKTLKAQNIILAETEKQFKGAAEATGTYSDKIAVMLDNLQESFGAAFLPVLKEVLPGVQKFLTEMEPLLVAVGEGIAGVVTNVAGSEAKLAAAATKLGEFIGKGLKAATPFVSAALEALLISLTSTIPEMATTIGLLAESIITTVVKALPTFIQAAIDGMLKLIQALADRSSEWVTPMVESAVDIIEILVTELTKQENIDTLTAAGNQFGAALWDGLVRSFGADWDTFFGNISLGVGQVGGIAPLTFGPTVGSVPSSARPANAAGEFGNRGVVNQTINFNAPVRTFAETVAASRYLTPELR